ncbi:MAG TPA: amidase [Pyrinomonadaceae bacterium]|nr:amidase [Pyrinomonadaceae bacterium]
MSDELTRLPAFKLAALIRARAVSPVEALEAHLRRVERLNPALNAVVAHAPDVLERAREAERALMRDGAQGLLYGVPVTIKDTIDVAGLPALAGSKARAGYVPATDAPSVAFLKKAGAIVIGKTNTSELALDYTTDNPVYGHANNPHDLARTSGGSSGGCAAAVAACLAAAGVGSDLAGSIRIPAHFCGVAGLKATAGRVSGVGHFPLMPAPYERDENIGPLARTVEDLGLMFAVLTGDAFGLGGEGLEVRCAAARAGLKGLRAAWYVSDGRVPVTPETREAVVRAAEALRAAGLTVEESRPPCVEGATELWQSVFSRATDEMVASIYEGREEEAGSLARVLLRRAAESKRSPREDGKKEAGRMDERKAQAEREQRAWAERGRLRAELLRWMERTPILVAPVGAVAAFKHEEARRVEVGGQAVSTFRAFSYAQAFNVFDLPAVSVPAWRTGAGLPVGVQIVGRPFEEESVLAAAHVVEEALGGWQPPPAPFGTADASDGTTDSSNTPGASSGDPADSSK